MRENMEKMKNNFSHMTASFVFAAILVFAIAINAAAKDAAPVYLSGAELDGTGLCVFNSASGADLSGTALSVNFSQAAEMAIAASSDFKNACAEFSINQQAWNFGLRYFFPRLGFSVIENDRLQELGPDSFSKNYAISLEQLLWDGGRILTARKVKRMELDAAFKRLDRMASEIADAALSAYRAVLSSRAVLLIRKASLENLAGQRQILAEEAALGLALPVDLAEADLTIAEAEIEIFSLQLDLYEMEQQFAGLLGLDIMPELSETVDTGRSTIPLDYDTLLALALVHNPDLNEAKLSVTKRQIELKLAARSWIPSIKVQGNFGLSGRSYPLTRANWSLGLSIEFSSPWLQNNFSMQTAWEPPYDRSAQLQNSAVPAPNPEACLSIRQAEQTLALEQEKYRLGIDKLRRYVKRNIEKCIIADRARVLAADAIKLAAERLRLEHLRLNLGQITRLELMETMIAYTTKEIAAVNAVVNLMEAERELERMLAFKPGELASLAALAIHKNDLTRRILYD